MCTTSVEKVNTKLKTIVTHFLRKSIPISPQAPNLKCLLYICKPSDKQQHCIVLFHDMTLIHIKWKKQRPFFESGRMSVKRKSNKKHMHAKRKIGYAEKFENKINFLNGFSLTCTSALWKTKQWIGWILDLILYEV